jgi:hypothetical protein
MKTDGKPNQIWSAQSKESIVQSDSHNPYISCAQPITVDSM